MHFDLPNPDTITRAVLANGITVLIYENPHVESVVIYGTLRAGSVYESPAQNGLASLTASSLMRGTHHRDFDTIHASLEDIGADLSFGASQHTVTFGGKALVEDFDTLVMLLNDCLRYPTFPSEWVDLLKSQRLTELRHSEQSTRVRANRAFRQAIYPADHPYHYASIGTLGSLPALSADDLHRFHAVHYGSQGMIVSVVGAIQAPKVLETLRVALEDWHTPFQPEEPILPPVVAPQMPLRIEVPIAGKSQADLLIGGLGPSRYDADYLAATLANSILGEFGMMGRIGNVIREQLGIAYYAHSRLDASEGIGTWIAAAGVAPQHIELALERIHAELVRMIGEPVSAEDFADNQAYFGGRLPLRLENSAGIAAILQTMERFNLGLDYLVRYRDLIDALTPEDLLRAAQRFLTPQALIISMAGALSP